MIRIMYVNLIVIYILKLQRVVVSVSLSRWNYFKQTSVVVLYLKAEIHAYTVFPMLQMLEVARMSQMLRIPGCSLGCHVAADTTWQPPCAQTWHENCHEPETVRTPELQIRCIFIFLKCIFLH